MLVTRRNEDKPGIFCYASNPRTNFPRRAHPFGVSRRGRCNAPSFTSESPSSRRLLKGKEFREPALFRGEIEVRSRDSRMQSFRINEAKGTEDGNRDRYPLTGARGCASLVRSSTAVRRALRIRVL